MPESDKYQSFYTVGHLILSLSLLLIFCVITEIKKIEFFLDYEAVLLNIWHNI